MRGMAKNCSTASGDELISYGSLSDKTSSLKEQLKNDFPADGALASLQRLMTTDGADSKDKENTAEEMQTDAMKLQERIRQVAKAKVAKMFEIFAPKSSEASPSLVATLMATAVATKVQLQTDECGVVVVNPKMWSETKTRPDALFAPPHGYVPCG